MDKLVRFLRHHHLVQLYAVVIVLLVQSMGKAKTFSCGYFPCLTVLLVHAPCDVRTAVAAATACGVGLLLLACYGVGGNQGREQKIGKEEEGEWLWGSLIYLQFSDIHFGVLLLWCVFGFSRLLFFQFSCLCTFVFSVPGEREASKQRWSVPPKSHSGPSLSFYPGQTVLQSMLDNLDATIRST
jgi:hypothetical protein